MKSKLQNGDALLIIDPQNDFIPGGALAVPQGDEVIPVLNDWIKAAQDSHIPIIVSRDWHPANHISFKAQGGPWPAHCVQDTSGAAFHKNLKIPASAIVVNKGFQTDQEAYSAFAGLTQDNRKLADYLRTLGVKRVWIGGLALDYCVYHSAVDAHKEGFKLNIILSACRGIAKKTQDEALTHLKQLNAGFETSIEPFY